MTKDKTKVVFMIHGLGVGGAEKFLVSLVNSLDQDSFECTLISYSESNPLLGELNKSVDFHAFGRKSKFDLNSLKRTRKLVKTIEPDVLFSVGFFSFTLFHLATLFFKTPVKRFISYHTTIHRSSKDDKMMKLYLKLLRKDDKIIGVCQNQIDYTSKRYNVAESKFEYIHNGVDSSHWRIPVDLSEKMQIRNKFAIPHSAKVITMTAAFRIEKNHAGALEAFKLLLENTSEEVYLMLVGDGPLKTSIIQLADEKGLSEKVIFAGKIDDVRPFYWSSDIFTLTSIGETFSVAALEALSCGLPCVLTDIGGANEMICSDINGFLSSTEPTDIQSNWMKAINYTFDQNKIAIETSKKFELKNMVESYQYILRQ